MKKTLATMAIALGAFASFGQQTETNHVMAISDRGDVIDIETDAPFVAIPATAVLEANGTVRTENGQFLGHATVVQASTNHGGRQIDDLLVSIGYNSWPSNP